MTDHSHGQTDDVYITMTFQTRAVLSQGGPRDAAVNFDKKFTTASRGFCATARLSCIVLHQRPFKWWNHSQYPDFHGRGVRHGDIGLAQNHGTRPVKATMIVNMWLFYSAKKCFNNWSQLHSLTLVAKHSISSVTLYVIHSLTNVGLHITNSK